jgi:ankyrin repeat protein
VAGKQPKKKDRTGVDRAGRTPLHYAANEGDVEDIRGLLYRRFDPSAPDDNGWTPLHFAAQKSSVDAVRILLNAGSAIDARDRNGNTPLSTAVFNSRGYGEVIRLLREKGADPNAENNHGVSPLKLARGIGNFNVRQFFDDLD